jgi:hypothetical protein
MMSSTKINRLIGIILIAAAVAGTIFSLFGLFAAWHYRPVITKNVVENLALLDQTLKATQDGLAIVDEAVLTTNEQVASLQIGTEALAKALHDSSPVLVSLSNLTGKALPAAVTAAQTSLTSAQSSALLIDNILGTLSNIPFSPVAKYNPEVPLHTALAQISSSLDELPTSLATISSSISASKTNIDVVEQQISKMSETVKKASDSLSKARDVIHQYQDVTSKLEERSAAAQKAAPGWITGATWLITFLLFWFIIAQLGLTMQGLALLREQSAVKQIAPPESTG